MGGKWKGKRLRHIYKERTAIKALQRTYPTALPLLNMQCLAATTMCSYSRLCRSRCQTFKGGRLQGCCGFHLSHYRVCGTPAVRLSSVPINTSHVFPVATTIIITIHRNDMLFGIRRRSEEQIGGTWRLHGGSVCKPRSADCGKGEMVCVCWLMWPRLCKHLLKLWKHSCWWVNVWD